MNIPFETLDTYAEFLRYITRTRVGLRKIFIPNVVIYTSLIAPLVMYIAYGAGDVHSPADWLVAALVALAIAAAGSLDSLYLVYHDQRDMAQKTQT